MHKRLLISSYRVLLALLTVVAIIAQFHSRINTATFSSSNFFSFFTIESNILAIVVFLVSSILLWRGKKSVTLDAIRGAATLYMVTTGLVYSFLLSGNEAAIDSTLRWVNGVVHQIMPVAVLLDWILVPPSSKITKKQMLGWFVFPLAYLAYSLIRGPHVKWYPYPFLNPGPHGYIAVVGYSIGIAVVIIGLGWAIRALGNRKTRA